MAQGRGHRAVGSEDGGGGEAQKGGDTGIHRVDSLPCTAETNIIRQLYSNKKK